MLLTGNLLANTFNLNLFGGVALSTLSNTASVSPTSGLTNTYIATESLQSGEFLGFGPEYVFDHLTTKPFTLGLGLSTYFIGLGNIAGTETPGSNIGLTDTLNYNIKASSIALMVEPKITYTKYALQPYALAGVGTDWNTLSAFTQTTPPGSLAAPSSSYADHTENSFAYEFAVGLQYQLQQNKKLSLRLEYRYLNLGDAQLGAAVGQTNNQRLASNDISTNIIDVGFSYQL